MFHNFNQDMITLKYNELVTSLLNLIDSTSLCHADLCMMEDEFEQEFEAGRQDVINSLKVILSGYGVISAVEGGRDDDS